VRETKGVELEDMHGNTSAVAARPVAPADDRPPARSSPRRRADPWCGGPGRP
jgi:hypothetical protein